MHRVAQPKTKKVEAFKITRRERKSVSLIISRGANKELFFKTASSRGQWQGVKKVIILMTVAAAANSPAFVVLSEEEEEKRFMVIKI